MNVAIAGCAHIHTPAYLRWLTDHPEIRVKAVGDRDPSRAESVAEQVASPVVDVDAIWTRPELDAVLILSETSLHRSYLVEAASRNLHIFVEKPLAMNSEEAEIVVAALEASSGVSHIAYFMREMPVIRRSRELVRSGALGTITRARISIAHDGALRGRFDDYRWMLDPAQAGFGGFGDMAVHGIDLCLWLFGSDVELATGVVGKVADAPPASDHYGEGFLRYRSGLVATVASSWVDAANPVMLEVRGTKGVVHVASNQVHAYGMDLKPAVESEAVGPEAALEVFIDAARLGDRNAPRVVAPREAAFSVRIAEACIMGAREQRWVAIT